MRFRRLNDEHVAFNCPGCGDFHAIRISGNNAWDWNGSLDSPTVSPSILVTYPANPDAIDEFKEWRLERRCHSFVRDGKIEFCSDSSHPLSGQTVELPEWDDNCW
jgi:hypothetical protein